MSLILILPPLLVLVHLLLALLVRRGDGKRRLLMALLLIGLAYPVQFLGLVLDLGNEVEWLARLCLFAPAILGVLSLLVYVPLIGGAGMAEEPQYQQDSPGRHRSG